MQGTELSRRARLAMTLAFGGSVVALGLFAAHAGRSLAAHVAARQAQAHEGRRVAEHVAPESGVELDAAELRRHCAERLEVHMVPGRVVFHAALPRTANGKVDRRALLGG